MRYGRVPKRSRERGGSSGGMDDNIRSPSGGFADPSTPDSSDSCSTGTGSTPPQQMTATPVRDPESRQLAIYDTILTVSQAFHAHCAYTEEKIRGIVRSPINIIVSLKRITVNRSFYHQSIALDVFYRTSFGSDMIRSIGQPQIR